jgi:hypothetical protein
MPLNLQLKFVCNAFHGKSDNWNSIGLVETIVSSGAGVAEEMNLCGEAGIVDPKTPFKTTAVSLQMKDVCTIDPAKAHIVGKLVAAEMLHGSTKNIAEPGQQELQEGAGLWTKFSGRRWLLQVRKPLTRLLQLCQHMHA